jgi:hypothetical protein
VSFLLSYTLRYVSLAELGNVCQVGLREPIHLCTCVVGLREPIHLCTCVSEEGGDGEGVGSEAPSLLSYTLRYISLTELGIVYRVGLREPIHLCTYVIEVGGDGETVCSETPSLLSYTLRSFVRTCEDRKKGEPRKVTRRNTNVSFTTVSASL